MYLHRHYTVLLFPVKSEGEEERKTLLRYGFLSKVVYFFFFLNGNTPNSVTLGNINWQASPLSVLKKKNIHVLSWREH